MTSMVHILYYRHDPSLKDYIEERASDESYEVTDDEKFALDFLSEITKPSDVKGIIRELSVYDARSFIAKHREWFNKYLWFSGEDLTPDEVFDSLETSGDLDCVLENMREVIPQCYFDYDLLSEQNPNGFINGGAYIGYITPEQYERIWKKDDIQELREEVTIFGITFEATATKVNGVVYEDTVQLKRLETDS